MMSLVEMSEFPLNSRTIEQKKDTRSPRPNSRKKSNAQKKNSKQNTKFSKILNYQTLINM